jgi:hypothetical protein
MRLPSYLHLAPSGVWHFRQRVPADLIRAFGMRLFKRTLHTRDVLTARRLALRLAEQYAQLFMHARDMHMSRERKPSIGAAVTAALGGDGYTLVMKPDGTIELKADAGRVRVDATDAAARIGPLLAEPYFQKVMADAATRISVSAPVSASSNIPVLPIGKVVTRWLT